MFKGFLCVILVLFGWRIFYKYQSIKRLFLPLEAYKLTRSQEQSICGSS